MQVELKHGFGTIYNIVPVRVKVANAESIVGEVHKHRRSGWRGGPSYQFHPNANGEGLGMKSETASKVHLLMVKLNAALAA